MSDAPTCDFCTQCRVRIYKPHATDDCPLKAAAYCSHCAANGLHFTKHCPNAPLRRRKDMPVVQGVLAAEPSTALVLKDDMDCVYSYLKLWGKDIRAKGYADKTVKRLLAEEALEHGYTSVVYN
jgi:hypothetical protein